MNDAKSSQTGDENLWGFVYPIAAIWLLIRSLVSFFNKSYFVFGVNFIIGIIVFSVLFYRQYWIQKRKGI